MTFPLEQVEGLDPKYVGVKIEALTVPHDQYVVLLNRWWMVYKDHAIFVRVGRRISDARPLCNRNEAIGKFFLKFIPGAEVRQLPFAYVPQDRC